MPRIRYLKPEFFTDEDLGDLSLEARLVFAGLWCYADKSGRLEDRPRFLKAMIFPYDDIDIEKSLDVLSQAKQNGNYFIHRYQIEKLKLIQIINWDKHQKPHHTEADSKYPPPDTPPNKEKITIKEKGTEKQNNPSTELRNVPLTGRTRLKSTGLYNCPFFQRFWISFPKKEAKGKAWEEWIKINPKPDENIITHMEKTIAIFINTEQWMKEGGQFIPLPSTWLHQRRWEDEPTKGSDTGNAKTFLEYLDDEGNYIGPED